MPVWGQDEAEQRMEPQVGSSLSLSFPAGHSPTGAVDRNAGCSEEPARLLPWPPGLRSCAPGPALLPAGMESVGRTWGLSWSLWQPGRQSRCRESLAYLHGLCAGFRAGHLRAFSWAGICCQCPKLLGQQTDPGAAAAAHRAGPEVGVGEGVGLGHGRWSFGSDPQTSSVPASCH